jgi:HSP20 family protein
MELQLDGGWMGDGWLFNGVRRLDDFERHALPQTDIVEDNEGYHFYFEMPGLKADSIDVRVEEERLVVEAERKRPARSKDAQMLIAERSYGAIRRAFVLLEDASRDRIEAAYRDGVLEVTVAKRPEAKPVKIPVNFEN